jgi:hypothetical protein
MGITGFTEWFRTTFPFAITPLQHSENAAEFDHILVDMNQFIHLHIRRAKNEEHLLIKVFSHLDKLFKLIWPRQSVLLALDGPGAFFFRVHTFPAYLLPGAQFGIRQFFSEESVSENSLSWVVLAICRRWSRGRFYSWARKTTRAAS